MSEGEAPEDSPQAVWTYRGYQLRAQDFSTAMAHFFRAYITRADVWRSRLDSTTNWAVVTTGAAISLAFNATEMGTHLVIPISTLLVTIFLLIEARRYRYYELWSSRVRLMETDFYAAMLVPPFRPEPDWAESLAENLLHPEFPVTFWEAFGRRYRYNYVWIYAVLAVAWFASLFVRPTPAHDAAEFVSRAAIGELSGSLVLTAGVLFNGFLFAIGVATMGLHKATGEVLPRYTRGDDKDESLLRGEPVKAWYRPGARTRRQLIMVIITSHARTLSRRIMVETGRGVTELSGRGAYTNKTQSLLMTALTVTEVANLKRIIREEDPQAFVVITPAQEVLGSGFMPLEEEAPG